MWFWTTLYFVVGACLGGSLCWLGWLRASTSRAARRRHLFQCMALALVWLPILAVPPLRALGAALRARAFPTSTRDRNP